MRLARAGARRVSASRNTEIPDSTAPDSQSRFLRHFHSTNRAVPVLIKSTSPLRTPCRWSSSSPAPVVFLVRQRKRLGMLHGAAAREGEAAPTPSSAKAAAVVDYRFARAPAVGPMLDAPFVPSPKGRIKRMFQLAELSAEDVLADLGCGDGRVLHAAASQFGCRCIGVELDEQLLSKAEAEACSLGVGDKCSWLLQNCSSVELKDATVIVVYMLPTAMGMLTRVLKQHLLQAKRRNRCLKIVTMVFHPDAVALRPTAIDVDWKLQLYDTSSAHDP